VGVDVLPDAVAIGAAVKVAATVPALTAAMSVAVASAGED